MERSALTRRALLRSTALASGGLAFGPGFYRRALAQAPAKPGPGPYGPLGAADANGVALPPGFTSRVIANGGQAVAGTAYPWHTFTDGGSTFPTGDGGWIAVFNSEVQIAGAGGASSITFDRTGRITGARRVLGGTMTNCAGGPTPWGTWISCEEHDNGIVWECDPTGATAAVAHPALGTFAHESICVDPNAEVIYQTEDRPNGCFYRFTPTAYPDLTAGLLEVASVAGDGKVTWTPVPSPNQVVPPTRDQVPGATRFNGGEGTWFDSGYVFFTTKGDRKVWTYHTATQTLTVLYDAAQVGPTSPLQSVDNVVVHRSGELFVCEDGDNMEICVISPDRQVAPFLRLDPRVHGADNETVGVTFNPDGTRMYFGAQRTNGVGQVLEISGPFGVKYVGPPAGVVVVPPVLTPSGEGKLTPADRIAPGVKLKHGTAISTAALLKSGLALTLELDEPARVEVRLVGGRTLARRTTSVAVAGRVRLRLKPSTAVARTLRRRTKRLSAQLVITVTDKAGNKRTVRRKVTIKPPPRTRTKRRR